MPKVANHRHAVSEAIGTCGLSCSTSTVRYAAPSAPAISEFVSMRRNRIVQVYTSAMPASAHASARLADALAPRRPVDVDARVISNARLSEDYSVIRLAAPEIAARARPGQFVMVKASRSSDPLLRRPFSIFEVLRDDRGAPAGVSLLNKRIGVGTKLLYEAEAGARVACLGPLGRPFEPIDPPGEAWMAAG